MTHRLTYHAIDHQFTHHPPRTDVDVQVHETLRAGARDLAHEWNDLLPDSEEKTEAMRRLREAVMWANAALAVARI